MWNPKSSAYYPADKDAAITMKMVIEENDGEVLSFAGTLEGWRGWKAKSRVNIFVLAWRRTADDKSFAVYWWDGGQQERVGTVKVEDVIFEED